ncbi:hypothetical protein B0T10DRAFT_540156 [Thelonectria olida]|uniref:Uncharacterized protein n=1 Tax=Thelonectria olida TaxID=1576542 RepID=A0A9P8VW28_9HYPO|nr:hypothetical protein B0T10DRAFT_540156 [Thelonectria olida]
MSRQPHHNTPKKAKVRGAFEFMRAKGIPFYKTDLFSLFQVSYRSGNGILAAHSSRRRHNDPTVQETRDRPKKLSEADLNAIEALCEDEGFEAKRLPWPSLALEARVETDASTFAIQKSAATRDLYKRLAEQVEYVKKADADRRFNYAVKALEKRPELEDWYDICRDNIFFSDESHFGYGDGGQALIARKLGTRNDPPSLQERREPDEKDLKRLNAWAAIGYNFKSDLIWYEVPTNRNGKMTQAVYREKNLEAVVKRWIEEGRTVRTFGKHGLDYFFNCPSSPDLSPVENTWPDPKEYSAQEGWDNLKQETINNWIRSIPQRLCDVKELHGKMTG